MGWEGRTRNGGVESLWEGEKLGREHSEESGVGDKELLPPQPGRKSNLHN